jgi:hypothetical protein
VASRPTGCVCIEPPRQADGSIKCATCGRGFPEKQPHELPAPKPGPPEPGDVPDDCGSRVLLFIHYVDHGTEHARRLIASWRLMARIRHAGRGTRVRQRLAVNEWGKSARPKAAGVWP